MAEETQDVIQEISEVSENATDLIQDAIQDVAVVCTMDVTFLRDGSRLQAGQSKMVPADEAAELEAQERAQRV